MTKRILVIGLAALSLGQGAFAAGRAVEENGGAKPGPRPEQKENRTDGKPYSVPPEEAERLTADMMKDLNFSLDPNQKADIVKAVQSDRLVGLCARDFIDNKRAIPSERAQNLMAIMQKCGGLTERRAAAQKADPSGKKFASLDALASFLKANTVGDFENDQPLKGQDPIRSEKQKEVMHLYTEKLAQILNAGVPMEEAWDRVQQEFKDVSSEVMIDTDTMRNNCQSASI